MESTKAEQLPAMKSYKKSQFLSNLVLHSITALISTLLCSFPFWYPKLCSSVEQFFLVSLPNFKASFFNPKCLFVLGNAIIVFLVGESKLAGSGSYPPAGEIYDEYAERMRTMHEVSVHVERKDENVGFETEESLEMIEDKYMIEEEQAEEAQARDPDGDDHESEEEEQEESGLPAEELNKRVEDFIAMFNRQRWLEARELDNVRG
ncbi:hypothetical protein NMG60_11024676 [Bertholletia excelsa]